MKGTRSLLCPMLMRAICWVSVWHESASLTSQKLLLSSFSRGVCASPVGRGNTAASIDLSHHQVKAFGCVKRCGWASRVRLPTVFVFHSWGLGLCGSSDNSRTSEGGATFSKALQWQRRSLGSGSEVTGLRSHSAHGQDIEDISSCVFAPSQAKEIADGLVSWYNENARDLPWRDQARWPQPAYAVWVSEMMLQQTRVQTVLDYFERWMAKWPTVHALAAATEEEVNEMWSGLGYYRRAKFLHQGAKEVVATHNGELPSSAEQLRTLPGIGEYTAGAIASIAFNRQEALVDGNVVRVLARLKALPDDPKASASVKAHWRLARALVDNNSEPAALNQALMELGATVCTPTTPSCSICPVAASCLALKEQNKDPSMLVTRFPPKVVKAAVRNQTVAVCIVTAKLSAAEDAQQETRMLLVRRPATGLLASLWEFPTVIVPEDANEERCKKDMAKYLTRAAKTMAMAAGESGGQKTNRRQGTQAARSDAGTEVSAAWMSSEGETSFLFSHINQKMLVFSLQLPASHVLASRTQIAAAADAEPTPAAVGTGKRKGKAAGRVKGGKRSREDDVVLVDDDEEEEEPAGKGGKKGVQAEASPPTSLRWVPESGLEGAALPRVARKALEVLDQDKTVSTSKKRKKGAMLDKDEDGSNKQTTLSHFFSRINK